MKKVLASILSLAILFSGCSGLKQPLKLVPIEKPKPVTDSIGDSIGRFTIVLDDGYPVGTCTAFAIAPRKFLTAAHCVPDKVQDWTGTEFPVKFKLDGIDAHLLKKDEDRDLAIILVDIDKRPVEFRAIELERHEVVYGVGFGYGLKEYLVTENKVMLLNYSIDVEDKMSWPGTIFMTGFIGGMSGGPIIDMTGRVVGMVQAGTAQIGYGVTTDTIKTFLLNQ